MLYTIAVVLILLWLLGMVSSYTIHGFIHILLVIAVIMVLLRIIKGAEAVLIQVAFRILSALNHLGCS